MNDSATLIDIPEEPIGKKQLNDSATLIDIPEEPKILKKTRSIAAEFHEKPTFIVNPDSIESKEKSQIFFSAPQINNVKDRSQLSTESNTKHKQELNLEIKPYHSVRALESWQNLSPNLLWQELLARIISKGIGRLYLQQHHNYGRILCSQDGVVQSSLDKVPIAVYDGVIKEIKIMAKLPLNRIKKSQKVALKRYYNHEKVLLRIEFMIGNFGEEATIQVLRGQALKFYEQRQVDKSLEQAIYLGQKLEKTIGKIKKCRESTNTGDLTTLKIIMQQINKQLESLEF